MGVTMSMGLKDDRGTPVRPFSGWAVTAIRLLRSFSVFVTLVAFGYIGVWNLTPGTGLAWMVPVAIVAVAVAAASYPFLLRRAYGIRLRSGMLGAGRCASCGYALKGVRAMQDGCTVCPECGGAWKLVAVGTRES